MKRLFWASLIIPLLFSCSTTSDEEIVRGGYNLSGVDAQEYYKSSNSTSARVLYNLAYSYIETASYEEALEVAKQGQELHPEHIRFISLEAYCHKALGDIESYEAALKRILEVNPGNIEISEMLITSLVENEKKDEAIKYSNKLLTLSPTNKTALNTLSRYIPFYRDITGYRPDDEIVRDTLKKYEESIPLSPELKTIKDLLVK